MGDWLCREDLVQRREAARFRILDVTGPLGVTENTSLFNVHISCPRLFRISIPGLHDLPSEGKKKHP